jgi:hypothetical protein
VNTPKSNLMQFSLRSMLLVAPIFGLALLALKRPSLLILQLVFAATLLALLSSLAISVFGRPQDRPFAFGFASFGICYIAIVALLGEFDTPDKNDTPLLSSRLLQHLYVPVVNPVPPPAGMGGGDGRYAIYDPPEHLFRRIGHTVFALMLAFVGGTFANLIHRLSIASNAGTKAAEQRDAP